jgi:hypothetical protein
MNLKFVSLLLLSMMLEVFSATFETQFQSFAHFANNQHLRVHIKKL